MLVLRPFAMHHFPMFRGHARQDRGLCKTSTLASRFPHRTPPEIRECRTRLPQHQPRSAGLQRVELQSSCNHWRGLRPAFAISLFRYWHRGQTNIRPNGPRTLHYRERPDPCSLYRSTSEGRWADFGYISKSLFQNSHLGQRHSRANSVVNMIPLTTSGVASIIGSLLSNW